MDLVRGDNVEGPRFRHRQMGQQIVLAGTPGALLPPRSVFRLAGIARDREHDRPELVRDLFFQQIASIRARVLQHVVKDAGHQRRLVAVVTCEDHRHVGGMPQTPGRCGAGASMMLCGKGESVIDPVGVGVHRRRAGGAGKRRGKVRGSGARTLREQPLGYSPAGPPARRPAYGMPRSLCVCRLSRQRG
jgi:hypothetical protein